MVQRKSMVVLKEYCPRCRSKNVKRNGGRMRICQHCDHSYYQWPKER